MAGPAEQVVLSGNARKMRYHRAEWSPRAASFAAALALLAVMQLASQAGLVSPFIMPAPSDIFATVPRLVAEDDVLGKFSVTLGSTVAAVVAAVAVGIAIGWSLFRWPTLGRAYEGWFAAAFSAPLVLLYPLFLVVFGRGISTILIMAAIAGTIPVVLNTLQGLRAVPPVYLNVARTMRMTDAQIAFKVMLPAALPVIFTGARLGLIYIIIYIVSLEYMIGIGGLGSLVALQYDRYDIPGMFAAIGCVLFATILVFVAAEKLERWLISQ